MKVLNKKGEIAISYEELIRENEELKIRLSEAEDTLNAIRSGCVDAVVVESNEGNKIFTLEGADYPYRILFETMNEGAATTTSDLHIMFCNKRLSELVNIPINKIVGKSVLDFIHSDDLRLVKKIIKKGFTEFSRGEIRLKCGKNSVPVLLSCNPLQIHTLGICMIFTELTDIKKLQEELKKTNENLEKTVAKRTEQVIKSNELLTAEISERKRTEEELIKSEKKYRDLIYYAPSGIYEVDFRSKKFVSVNDAMCHMLGYTREELLKISPFDILDSEGKKLFKERISKWLRGEKPEENTEYRIFTKDGHDIYSVLNVTFTTDNNGNPYGANVIAHDISDRKKAEIELRNLKELAENRAVALEKIVTELKTADEKIAESEARLKRSQEMAHLGSWELDLEKNVLTWSDEVFRIFGLQPQEFKATYEAFLHAVHPEDRTAVDQAFINSVKNNLNSYEIEHRIIRKHNKETRYVHEKCIHIKNETGKIIRSLGMVHDITERKKSEIILSHHSFLINNINDAVVAFDDNLQITFWNKAAENVYGWKAEEVIGKIGPDILRTVFPKESVKKAEKNGGHKADVIHYHKDGRPLNIESIFTVVKSQNEKTFEYISVNRDVTERKKMEDEIRMLAKFPGQNPNPVIRVSPSGNILYANNSSTELLNIWNCVIGEKVPQILQKEIIYSYKNKIQKNVELSYHSKTFLISIKPIPDEGYANLYGKDITEIKNYEKALKQSEESLRNILDATQEGISLLDKNGFIITANITYAKRLNKTLDEVINHKFTDFIDSKSASIRLNQLHNVFKTNTIAHFEDVREGRYLEHHYFPYFRNGEVLYAATYTRDITENKIAAEKLEQVSKRLQFHFDNSPLAVVEWDSDYNVTMWSGQAEKIFGWKASETIGRKIMDLNIIVEEDIQIVNNTMKKLSSGKEVTVTSSNRNYTKDRSIIECTWHNSVLTDENGKMISVLSLVEDITESKKAAKALKDSEERFKAIAETTPVGLGVIDISTDKFIYVNSAYKNRLGYTSDELTNMKVQEIYWSAEERKNLLKVLKDKGLINDYEIKLKKKDGALLWGMYSIHPITFNGKSALLGAFIDITERKKVQEQLQASELRYRVLFETMSEGFSIIDLVYDKSGNPADFRYVDANPAFEAQTGIRTSDIIGKLYSEIFPNSDQFWVKKYGEVALSGKTCYFERKFMPLNRWYEVSVYPSNPTRAAVVFNDITNRKLSEEALKNSEEKYRELVENANSIILKMDIHGRFTFFNEFASKFFGFTEKEILGKTALETIVPETDTTGRDLKIMLEALYNDPDKFINNINENVKKNGERVLIEWHNKALFDSKGDRLGHIAIGTDITDRVKAEMALKKYSMRLEILSETASRLLASENPQKIINELCLKVMHFLDCQVFFNYIVDDLHNKLHLNAYNGIPEKTAKRIEWLNFGEAVCGCSARDGKRVVAEDIFNTLDPRTDLVKSFGVRAYCAHPLKTHNEVLGTLSFGTITRDTFTDEDLTLMKAVADQVSIAMTRMKNEEEIKLSREKLKMALENGNVGTWEWDLQTNKVLWDERMYKLFGVEQDNFDNSYDAFEKCLVEDDIQHVRKAISHAVEKNNPFDTIYRIHYSKDDIRYITAKGLVEKNSKGEPLKMIGVSFDITDLKKSTDQALFKLNEDLLRSNKELEQFAYVASHDLQEPLRMVSSFTQLLYQRYHDKLDQDANEFIQFAVDGATRMQYLINDLLSYSRVQTRGKEFTEVDMCQVLGTVRKNLQIIMEEKNGFLTNSELPVIYADEGQMVQLFQNLIGNALKFNKQKPLVHVSTYTDNGYDVFKVKDNGIGIEPQYYEKIFQIFQRLQSKEEYSGTGIGLAICKRIVERHGGKIWVESEPGKGSTFYFSIKKKHKLKMD